MEELTESTSYTSSSSYKAFLNYTTGVHVARLHNFGGGNEIEELGEISIVPETPDTPFAKASEKSRMGTIVGLLVVFMATGLGVLGYMFDEVRKENKKLKRAKCSFLEEKAQLSKRIRALEAENSTSTQRIHALEEAKSNDDGLRGQIKTLEAEKVDEKKERDALLKERDELRKRIQAFENELKKCDEALNSRVQLIEQRKKILEQEERIRELQKGETEAIEALRQTMEKESAKDEQRTKKIEVAEISLNEVSLKLNRLEEDCLKEIQQLDSLKKAKGALEEKLTKCEGALEVEKLKIEEAFSIKERVEKQLVACVDTLTNQLTKCERALKEEKLGIERLTSDLRVRRVAKQKLDDPSFVSAGAGLGDGSFSCTSRVVTRERAVVLETALPRLDFPSPAVGAGGGLGDGSSSSCSSSSYSGCCCISCTSRARAPAVVSEMVPPRLVFPPVAPASAASPRAVISRTVPPRLALLPPAPVHLLYFKQP